MRRLMFFLVALCLLPVCACRSESNSPSPSPVFVVVKGIEPKFEQNPVTGNTSAEVLVTLDVGNRGRGAIRFERLQAVFLGDQKPIAALTCILKHGQLDVIYPPEGGGTPPDVQPEETFEIAPGEGGRFYLQSANSNFGALAPSIHRRVAVTLLTGGKVEYGPFDIELEALQSTQEADRGTFSRGDVVNLPSPVNNLEAGLYVVRSLEDHQVVLSRCWTSDSIPRGQGATVYSGGLAVGDKTLITSDSALSHFQKTGQRLMLLR